MGIRTSSTILIWPSKIPKRSRSHLNVLTWGRTRLALRYHAILSLHNHSYPSVHANPLVLARRHDCSDSGELIRIVDVVVRGARSGVVILAVEGPQSSLSRVAVPKAPHPQYSECTHHFDGCVVCRLVRSTNWRCWLLRTRSLRYSFVWARLTLTLATLFRRTGHIFEHHHLTMITAHHLRSKGPL